MSRTDVRIHPFQLSLYAMERSWMKEGTQLRRYTLRLDGFVSIHAKAKGGELLTKPLQFEGNRLTLNFATSAIGSVQVEIQDANGKPIPDFTLADCSPVFGDDVERTVTWKSGFDVSRLAGQPVRLRFVMKDTDLYSFRFDSEKESDKDD